VSVLRLRPEWVVRAREVAKHRQLARWGREAVVEGASRSGYRGLWGYSR